MEVEARRQGLARTQRIEAGVGSKAWTATPKRRIIARSQAMLSPTPNDQTTLSGVIPSGQTVQTPERAPSRTIGTDSRAATPRRAS